MPEQPTERRPAPTTPTRAQPRIVLYCPACGRTDSGEGAQCLGCGHGLLRPEAAQKPSWRALWRLLGASAVAIAFGAFFWLNGDFWGPSLPPSLGGVRIGETATTVEQHLGRPARKPTEVFWNGTDGKPHRVGLWQYGLVPDSQTPIADLTVTFLDGKVFEVGALDKNYKTSEGLRIGDSLHKASHLYGTAIEEDLVSGLLPTKFLKGGVVVKVVTMPGDDHVLAIGLESPRNLPLPPTEGQHETSPGTSLGAETPTSVI